MLKVHEVHFNHDTGAATSDALNIRFNHKPGTTIEAPEWQDGSLNRPSAYAIQAVKEKLTIKARFVGGPAGSTLPIRALVVDQRPSTPARRPGLSSRPLGRSQPILDSVLGSVGESDVSFDASGTSQLTELDLARNKINKLGIGVYSFTWRWQVRLADEWSDFDSTNHVVYLVLNTPREPWSQESMVDFDDNLRLPWVEALTLACQWASGAKSELQAARKIVERINRSPLLSYTPDTKFMFENDYLLSSFLKQISGTLSFKINCTDCANTVSALANLIGCDLAAGSIDACGVFETRKILLLGKDPDDRGSWESKPFVYHEVAWLSASGDDRLVDDRLVFDASLQLDLEEIGEGREPKARLPIGMIFGRHKREGFRRYFFLGDDYRLQCQAVRRRPI